MTVSHDPHATPAASAAPLVDVGRYARAARRAWWFVVLLAVLGAVAGYLLLPGSTYESKAVVQVDDGLVDLSTRSDQQSPNMSTEIEVAQSALVVSRVVERTARDLSVDDFLAGASVTSPPDSTTLTFRVTAPSADQARAEAQAWARIYLRHRERSLSRDLATVRDRTTARRDRLRASLARQQARLAAANPSSTRASNARAAVNDLTRQVSSAQANLDRLAGLDVDAGRPLGRASTPSAPGGLSAPQGLLLGGLSGVVLGLALALLLERANRRVRDSRDLARATGAGIWAVLGTDADQRRLEHDALAARVALLVRRSGVRTVLVTSATDSPDVVAAPLVSGLRALDVGAREEGRLEALLDVDRAGDAVLVVPAPPALRDPRTAIMSSQADVTLLVVERDAATLDAIAAADARIRESGGAVSGVVLVRRRPARPRLRRRSRPDWAHARRGGRWRRASRPATAAPASPSAQPPASPPGPASGHVPGGRARAGSAGETSRGPVRATGD